MDEEKEKEEGDAAFVAKREEMQRGDQARTEKNRQKREKARLRASKKKGGNGGGAEEDKALGAGKKDKFRANDAVGGGRVGEGNDGEVRVAPEVVGIVIHDED